jgi:NAD(P)-dependent dehydrogenase (short-subunit alcohol dehydrogenase family)
MICFSSLKSYKKRDVHMANRMKADLGGMAGIITGAGSGMGKEIAFRLTASGASAMLADIDFDAVMEVRGSIVERGGSAFAVKADVSSEVDVKNMVKACMETFHTIDFLISNAGTVGPYRFEDTTKKDWDDVFAVNTRGGFLCAHYILPQMKKRRKGRIVFNASTNGGKPGEYVIAYRASKAALIMLARSLALYAAPYGVTVNAICPGVTMTDMQKKLTESLAKEQDMSFEEHVVERTKRVPMGRFTKVEDIADIAEFLVSDSAEFITGQVIYINGGEWL